MNKKDNTTSIVNDGLLEYMTKEIKKSLEHIFEEQKNIMIEKMDKEKDYIISGIALNLTKSIDMRTGMNEIVLTLKTNNLK